jgi:hypothetical protein
MRPQEFGWNDLIGRIQQIPEEARSDINSDNIYPVNLATIRRFKENCTHQSVCPAQNAFMLYKCLMNSISKK